MVYPNTDIGHSCLIHSGTVIGSDGFEFDKSPNNEWSKKLQHYAPYIGDNVEIGANCTIDGSSSSTTTIGDGVKIDNQVHIAHGVIIGDHTAIAGCVGIAGNATIGKYCTIGGKAGINGEITICDHTIITAMSMVTKSIKTRGIYSSGIPVDQNREWNTQLVRIKQLDTLYKRVSNLEKHK